MVACVILVLRGWIVSCVRRMRIRSRPVRTRVRCVVISCLLLRVRTVRLSLISTRYLVLRWIFAIAMRISLLLRCVQTACRIIMDLLVIFFVRRLVLRVVVFVRSPVVSVLIICSWILSVRRVWCAWRMDVITVVHVRTAGVVVVLVIMVIVVP